jgi:hypothetical protein
VHHEVARYSNAALKVRQENERHRWWEYSSDNCYPQNSIIWLVEAAVAAGYNTDIVEQVSRVAKLDVTLLHSSESKA